MSAESFKYQMVSIGSMNTQINIRLPNTFLKKTMKYVERHGYVSIQELIKDTLREVVYEDDLKLSKETIKAIEESKKQIARGQYVTHKEAKARLGL